MRRLRQTSRQVLLAWLLALVSVVSASAQLIAWLAGLTARPTLFLLVEAFGWSWALPIVLALTAAAIVARRPRHRVGWLLMIPALFASTFAASFSSALNPITPSVEPDLADFLLVWANNWGWVPIMFPVILIPLHFPSGRPPSPRWRWINRLAVTMVAVFMLLATFEGTFTMETQGVIRQTPNPIGFIPSALVEQLLGLPWTVAFLTLVGSSVTSLFVRYRRAGHTERQQIKWLLFASAVFMANLLVAALSSSGQSGPQSLLFVLGVLGIPLAIGVAILRYQLFDIDVIIRKTATYALLTGFQALIYFGSVVLLQLVFESTTGERSPLTIVMSTLLIAVFFTPLRRRVQTLIDRRFYRRRYDAQKVLERFAATARDEVALEILTAEIDGVVREALAPDSMSIWLRQTSSGKPQRAADRV